MKVAAPPVDGSANEELVSVIARKLQLRKSAVRVLHGAGSRSKVLEIDLDISESDIVERLTHERGVGG